MKFSEDIRPKLVAQAPDVPVRNDLKLDFYISNAFQYREQGKAFVAAGDWERGYIMLLRFCNLATGTIPKHKHYMLEKYSRDRQTLRRQLENALDVLEQITDKLDKKYANMTLEDYEKMKQEQDAAREKKKQEEEEEAAKPKSAPATDEKKTDETANTNPSADPAVSADEKKDTSKKLPGKTSAPLPSGPPAAAAAAKPAAVSTSQPPAPAATSEPASPPPPFGSVAADKKEVPPPAAPSAAPPTGGTTLRPGYAQPPKDDDDGPSPGYPILP
eukprot:TRINITY_DN63964_c0_g2_i1.p1 TRINITY_DN63964_c0_g2~~TRINITY_DN63964_c0_g2_i1.p1  ORF type:complete len:273 (-),score=101.65 TRINITY_DN63964_c0_g2_i1:108-926(-)